TSSPSLLAMCAEPSSASADRCRFQFAAATRAFVAFPASPQEPRFGHEAHISFRIDCFFQNVARCPKQLADILLAQMGGVRRRVHAYAEENFVGINVSDARDQLLVEQNRFHRATM